MKGLVWVFALLLTVAAAYYQIVIDPAQPVKTELNTGVQRFPIEFARSHSSSSDCPVVLQISDIAVKGALLYKKYPSKDTLTKVDFKREGDKLVAFLPSQPRAGKLEYKIDLKKEGVPVNTGINTPVVIQFKGDVPNFVSVLHFLFVFAGMLLCILTGIYALFGFRSYKFLTVLTFIVLVVGGLVFGSIVHKYAFNKWWTGMPFGWDQTDNKTLIAILFWLMAIEMLRRKSSAFWVVVASIVTIVIFALPHSLFGSQLDQATGKIIQGTILPFLQLF
jgi:hypothetical protein